MKERLAAVETMSNVHSERISKIEETLADISKSVNRSTVILSFVVPAVTAAIIKFPGM